MKELLKRKTTKNGIAVIILAVAIGIISINARSAQKQKEYDGHIEAAERYLTVLDYEQAIAEYTLALEIEPNNEEVLNVLEQTYLDYTQSLADAGEYEKAVSVLEEGYAQTGRESLWEKIEELKSIQEHIVEFPFELTDITIMGYDLFEDHYEEICAAYGCPVDTDWTSLANSTVDNEYGLLSSSVVISDDENQKSLSFRQNSSILISYTSYDVYREDTVDFAINLSFDNKSYMAADLEFYGFDVPLELESSDEDWNQIMQVQKIKERGEQYEFEYDNGNGDGTGWLFQTKWGRGRYIESMFDDGHYNMELEIVTGEQTIEGAKYVNEFVIFRRVDKNDTIHYKYEYRHGQRRD